MSEDIKAILREYVAGSPILRRPVEVSDTTPLATYGILDSVAMLDLVLFIETRFGIEFSARDLDRRRIETIDHIESLVRAKLAHKKAGQGGPGT